jgi:hypothetical protein
VAQHKRHKVEWPKLADFHRLTASLCVCNGREECRNRPQTLVAARSPIFGKKTSGLFLAMVNNRPIRYRADGVRERGRQLRPRLLTTSGSDFHD